MTCADVCSSSGTASFNGNSWSACTCNCKLGYSGNHCQFQTSVHCGASVTTVAAGKSGCAARGGYLASPTTWQTITDIRAQNAPTYILTAGLDSTDGGQWVWQDGPDEGRQFWSGDSSGTSLYGTDLFKAAEPANGNGQTNLCVFGKGVVDCDLVLSSVKCYACQYGVCGGDICPTGTFTTAPSVTYPTCTCGCKALYGGDHCRCARNGCSVVGGTMVQGLTSCSCVCNAGYSGPTCSFLTDTVSLSTSLEMTMSDAISSSVSLQVSPSDDVTTSRSLMWGTRTPSESAMATHTATQPLTTSHTQPSPTTTDTMPSTPTTTVSPSPATPTTTPAITQSASVDTVTATTTPSKSTTASLVVTTTDTLITTATPSLATTTSDTLSNPSTTASVTASHSATDSTSLAATSTKRTGSRTPTTTTSGTTTTSESTSLSASPSAGTPSVSLTTSGTHTDTMTAEQSQTLTSRYCFNGTWPPVGLACLATVDAKGCAPGIATITFDQWSAGVPETTYIQLAYPMTVQPDAYVQGPPPERDASDSFDVRQLHPDYVHVRSDTTGANVTVLVFAEVGASGGNGARVRVDAYRQLASGEATVAVVAEASIVLEIGLNQAPLRCQLPRLNESTAEQSGLHLRLWGVLFDSPPPLVSEGTRKAATAATSMATLAAAGPIAADLQVLAALGSSACSPGGGKATGRNAEATDDNTRSLSVVALDGTCGGVVRGNLLALGVVAVVHMTAVATVVGVFRMRGAKSYTFLQAASMLRLPSFEFTLAASLHVGFVVCGVQLTTQGETGVDYVIGGAALLVSMVLLPVVPGLLAWLMLSRRRHASRFVSWAVRCPPSLGQPNVPPPPTKPMHAVQRMAQFLFLPSSQMDRNFHPIAIAFTSLVGRNRLRCGVWSSLPYVPPLFLLPVLLAPPGGCTVPMVVAAVLYVAAAVVLLVFRPGSILFQNVVGAASLLINGALVGATAALMVSPRSQMARTVAGGVGNLQLATSVVRLLHAGIVSGLLPLLMNINVLPKPVIGVECAATTAPPVPPPLDEEEMDPVDTDDDLDLKLDDGDTLSEPKEDVAPPPMWEVRARFAPQWPPKEPIAGAADAAGGLLGVLFLDDVGPLAQYDEEFEQRPPSEHSDTASVEADEVSTPTQPTPRPQQHHRSMPTPQALTSMPQVERTEAILYPFVGHMDDLGTSTDEDDDAYLEQAVDRHIMATVTQARAEGRKETATNREDIKQQVLRQRLDEARQAAWLEEVCGCAVSPQHPPQEEDPE